MDNLYYLERFALAIIGTPYIWGGHNPDGYDCSGLACTLLGAGGIVRIGDIRTAQQIFDFLGPISKASREAGSFAFYGASRQSIKHVAYCLNDTWCIEAYGDGSCKTRADAMKYGSGTGAYVRLSQIRRRSDIVACLRPQYPWEK